MSFDIELYTVQTKQREQAAGDDSFFDRKENLIPFSHQQRESLKKRLIDNDYTFAQEDGDGWHFTHAEYSISVLLSDRGLYFSAQGEGAFEAGMTASEFTDEGEFAKYDPQNGGWEEE